MRPHKIFVKTFNQLELKDMQDKIVIFANKNGHLGKQYFPLRKELLELLKSVILTRKFKLLKIGQGITFHNPFTFSSGDFLIVKIDETLATEQLNDIGKLISNFKGSSKISILWGINNSLELVARIIQCREYSCEDYRKNKKLKGKIGNTVFFAISKKIVKDFRRTNDFLAEGVFWCRDLVNAPANILNTKEFTEELKLLRKIGVKVSVLNKKQLTDLQMNALLSVGRGSSNPSRVVVLEWRGHARKNPPIALIGKGVMFDTGGISLKSPSGMSDMTMDMAGAATVAGVIKSVALSKLRTNVVGLVGLVENMPGPLAQRPGDIVKSMKGDTIEVNNTDAEGRLILADLLWYTQKKFKPEKILDLATLTGAVIIALGHEYAGVFSNNDKFCKEFLSTCSTTQEKAWRLPLDESFKKSLKSRLADLSNVGGRQGSSIIAAMFLDNFVDKKIPWIHLDIAGVAKTNSDSLYSKGGATGWGVISIFQLIRNSVKKLET